MTFYRNRYALFLGPMCWVGGGQSAADVSSFGRLEITSDGRFVGSHYGATLIGG